jgi:TonB family protein
MKTILLFPVLVVALLSAPKFCTAQTQNGTQSHKTENTEKQAAQLKPIKRPTAPYPDEALKKNIEGKVVMSIVVDAQGKVSDVKVLSGPLELVQAAVESVEQWQFEPPSQAPVVTTAEVGYGRPKKCPGAISDQGEVIVFTRLTNERGRVVGMDESIDQPLPPYFTDDRKAGVSGDMVLSVTVNDDGKVAKVVVIKSLSTHLDEAAIETVRVWKFKIINGNASTLPDEFQLHISYLATCAPLL